MIVLQQDGMPNVMIKRMDVALIAYGDKYVAYLELCANYSSSYSSSLAHTRNNLEQGVLLLQPNRSHTLNYIFINSVNKRFIIIAIINLIKHIIRMTRTL